jgi:hypothetical protein
MKKRKNIHDLTGSDVSRRFYDDDVLVPKKLKETLPQPSQSQIEFREEPQKLLLPYPWRLG